MTVLQDRPIFEDDYPTGPIDFHDPDDPFVRAMLEAEAPQEQPREANGRFGFKDKPLEYKHLQGPEPEPGTVNEFRFRTETLTDGSKRIRYASGFVSIVIPGLGEAGVLHPGDDGYADRLKLPAVVRAPARGPNVCNGFRTNGDPCERKTTYRKKTDPTIPLCHQHGGRKP